MNKMKNSSKKVLPTVFAAILVISVFAVVTTPVGAVTQEQKNEAIEKGLEWLAAQQNSDGSWTCQMHGQYNVSATAFAVLKFEHHAKEILGIDPFNTTYEYSDEIERGWHYIFNHTVCTGIDPQWNGTHLLDPDVNLVNGTGVYFISPETNRPGYETGIVMMALEASCHPEFIVDAPVGCVDGWTYLDVMKDTVDYIAWAQNDFPNRGRGGWRYGAYDNGTMVGPGFGWPDSDNSVSQWPALGLMSAAGWGVHAPDWVRTELEDYWLVYSRNSGTGCFGYASSTGGGVIAMTASGLTELTYCGVTTDDDRWVNARRCICENWGVSNIDNLYAMYGVMKASMIAQPEIIWWYNCSSGNHSWQEEYDEWLNETQLPDGSWPAGGWGDEILNTEWALLILQKVVPPLLTIEVDVDIKPGSCPNPLNLKSKGVLPVAVLGTDDFDVTTIDPETILLNRSCDGCVGVEPIRWDYEDVATPFEGALCDCHDLNGDGYLDLTLKFDTQELVETLELSDEAGNTIRLTLTGNLKEEEGGTAIEGADCIWVLETGKK